MTIRELAEQLAQYKDQEKEVIILDESFGEEYAITGSDFGSELRLYTDTSPGQERPPQGARASLLDMGAIPVGGMTNG